MDSGALVKLLVLGRHSEEVLGWAAEASAVACSVLAYPEVISALGRRFRAGSLPRVTWERTRGALEEQWPDLVSVPVDERMAGQLAQRHPLSGAGAVHLAAALTMARPGILVGVSSYDLRLNDAAASEGLRVLGPLSEPAGA
jgi:uncharacterized protein